MRWVSSSSQSLPNSHQHCYTSAMHNAALASLVGLMLSVSGSASGTTKTAIKGPECRAIEQRVEIAIPIWFLVFATMLLVWREFLVNMFRLMIFGWRNLSFEGAMPWLEIDATLATIFQYDAFHVLVWVMVRKRYFRKIAFGIGLHQQLPSDPVELARS